ncbi:MAG: nuclear transport factor 2 family protein [Salinarimonas sp.]
MTSSPTPLPEAERIARTFLADLERRDLDAAGVALAADAAITFPGGAVRRSIEEIVAGSAARYHRVGKHIERFDSLHDGADAIVYCFGTLHGVFADGEAFEGIRFIDRFVVHDGLIVRHDVWNDVAFARPPR